MMENYNILSLSVEVPEQPRRHARSKSSTPRPGVSDNLNSHTRQASQAGLPEMIARGLLDRGESLGINKTLMNAVSELKVS
jgi:TBC1 domain family member 5